MTETPREPPGDARRLLVEKLWAARHWLGGISISHHPHFGISNQQRRREVMDLLVELEATLSHEAVPVLSDAVVSDREEAGGTHPPDKAGCTGPRRAPVETVGTYEPNQRHSMPAEAVPSAPAEPEETT